MNRPLRYLFPGPFKALAVLILGISVLAAQQFTGEIRGKVSELERGAPLVGANVTVVGTNFGTATDLSGQYSLRIAPGTYSLNVKYVGYRQQTQEVTSVANTTVTLDFQLSVTALQLDEVIVTGQGSAIERRKLASPIETISAREVALAPVTSIDQLIQGRVPGMVSMVTSGQPGTAGRIRTRGIRSALSSQTPVIYIDGVRADNQDNFRQQLGTGGLMTSALSDILVGDIERVEVIKGGAAATLYGSDAANGVIQIFTKKGYAGTPKWTFSTTQGVDSPEDRWVREPFTKEKVLKSGSFQQYVANVTGGTDLSTYNISGRLQSSEGVVEKNNSRFYSLNGGMRSVLGEKLTAEFSAGFTNALYGGMYNNNAIASPLGSTEDSTIQRTPNPDSTLRIALLPDLTEKVNRFTTGLTTRYNPYDFLNGRFTVGIDYRKNEQRRFNPVEAQLWTSTPGGQSGRFDREYLQISLDAAVTVAYPRTGDVTSTLTVGVQGFREEDRQSFAIGSNFPVPGTDDFDNAATVTAGESNQQLFSGGFYIQENVGLFDRIFVDAGLRVDGNSAFGKDVGLQSYPKAGVAYNISDESFWPVGEIVNSFKLRASYGLTGKFPPAFTRDRTFAASRFLGVGLVTFNPTGSGNRELKPEKTTTIEAGFDAGFLDDRLALQFTWYQERTKEALFTFGLPPITGYTSQLRNIGEIENKGIEISINAVPISTPDVDFQIRVSYASLENKVVSLGGSAPFNIGGFAFLPLRVEEGQPIGVFRLNIPTPEQGAGTFEANVIDHGKAPTPKHTGSISTTLTLFRDLRISANADYAYGAYILNTGAVIRFFEGLYPETNRVPAGYNFATASSVWIEKADWFKMREISARYQIPSEFYEAWGLRSIAVNLSMRNVFAITPSKEFDPELHGVRAGRQLELGGINFFTLSPPRELRFGLEVTI